MLELVDDDHATRLLADSQISLTAGSLEQTVNYEACLETAESSWDAVAGSSHFGHESA